MASDGHGREGPEAPPARELDLAAGGQAPKPLLGRETLR
jgi:hypothetical protein